MNDRKGDIFLSSEPVGTFLRQCQRYLNYLDKPGHWYTCQKLPSYNLPISGCCRVGCLPLSFSVSQSVLICLKLPPSPGGLVVPRCLLSYIKQFPSYLPISRVGPVSFKYLFSIKTESQTISWKNKLSSRCSSASTSFLYH